MHNYMLDSAPVPPPVTKVAHASESIPNEGGMEVDAS